MKYLIIILFVFSFSLHASSIYTHENCEYSVTLPEKPIYRHTIKGELEVVTANVSIRNKGVYLRAQCLVIDDQAQFTDSRIREKFAISARELGIPDAEISLQTKPIGRVATISGQKTLKGTNIQYFIKYVIGDTSLMELFIIEQVNTYPSDETLDFLMSVRHK